MAKDKLTKRTVDALEPRSSGYIVWDAELRNYGVKVHPTGRKTYFVYYRTAAGTQRRPSLGTHGELTAEQARDLASDWLSLAKHGQDPSQDRQSLKKSMTIAQLCQRFMADHSNKKNKPRTAYNYQNMIDRFIVPTLGRKKVIEITREDVSRLHAKLFKTPYQANHVLALISKMMNEAEKDGHRADGSNPCRHVTKFQQHERQYRMSDEELKALSVELQNQGKMNAESPFVVAAIRLLIATGCRLSEILGLQWNQVDFPRRELRLSDSKTGPKTVALNGLAVTILRSIPRLSHNPHVIVGNVTGQPLVNLGKPWRRIRKLAKLDHVRIHDLRHTFASVAADQGISLHTIGRLLGHSQVATTKRYAHIGDNPLRSANESIGSHLAKQLGIELDEADETISATESKAAS